MPTSEQHLSWWIVEIALANAEASLSAEKRALYEAMMLHATITEIEWGKEV